MDDNFQVPLKNSTKLSVQFILLRTYENLQGPAPKAKGAKVLLFF